MVRDTQEGKADFALIYDGPMLERWAQQLTLGAQKYAIRNWMKASGEAEYDRFRASAARHFAQWMAGETDEDHAAAVFFNINGAEYVLDGERADIFEAALTKPCYESCDCEGPCGDAYYEAEQRSAVGDVTPYDVESAVREGASGDVADDYNYLRRRVEELTRALEMERAYVDTMESPKCATTVGADACGSCNGGPCRYKSA